MLPQPVRFSSGIFEQAPASSKWDPARLTEVGAAVTTAAVAASTAAEFANMVGRCVTS